MIYIYIYIYDRHIISYIILFVSKIFLLASFDIYPCQMHNFLFNNLSLLELNYLVTLSSAWINALNTLIANCRLCCQLYNNKHCDWNLAIYLTLLYNQQGQLFFDKTMTALSLCCKQHQIYFTPPFLSGSTDPGETSFF